MSAQEPNVGWTEALGEHAANPRTPRQTGADSILIFGTCAVCGGQRHGPDGEPCPGCRGTGRGPHLRAEYVLPPCENRIKAQFEQWLRRNARGLIQVTEAEEGPEEGSRLRSAYVADYAAGLYNWDGRHGRNARGDLPGIRYLLFLLLRRAYPDVTERQAMTLWKTDPGACSSALAWAVGNGETLAETETLPGERLRNGTDLRPAWTGKTPETEKTARPTAAPPTLDNS